MTPAASYLAAGVFELNREKSDSYVGRKIFIDGRMYRWYILFMKIVS